ISYCLCVVYIDYLSFTYSATTLTYTLSLHDALPIYRGIYLPCSQFEANFVSYCHTAQDVEATIAAASQVLAELAADDGGRTTSRSEEHTSELQSRENLVCRLLLEKKNEKHKIHE